MLNHHNTFLELQNHLKMEQQHDGQQGGGRLKAIIDTVIGNLQTSVTNIHIRYEVGTCHVLVWTEHL